MMHLIRQRSARQFRIQENFQKFPAAGGEIRVIVMNFLRNWCCKKQPEVRYTSRSKPGFNVASFPLAAMFPSFAAEAFLLLAAHKGMMGASRSTTT